jgi:hypothetical protein
MEATTRALDQLLRAVGNPIAEIRDIGPGHPEFIRAKVVRAAAGVLAKTPAALPAIADALRASDESSASPREQAHFAAAAAWLNGKPVLAAETYASILTSWPHDLLALRLAQSCYFFLGWHAELRAIVDSVWPLWQRDAEDFRFVLAMAAFAHAENGDASGAETLGREALKLNPACPIGLHAIAHAFAESGRSRLGANFMRDQVAHWGGDSRMRTHNAWHLAMFDADSGNVDSALSILDAWLLPPIMESALDACDAAALLHRLSAEGVEDEGRWRRISDAFEHTWTPGFWPYVDLHAGLAHLSAGQAARAERFKKKIDAMALGDDYAAWRARRITQPGLEALTAWAGSNHDQAAQLLAEFGPSVSGAGGSRVQLDIFRRLGREAVPTASR